MLYLEAVKFCQCTLLSFWLDSSKTMVLFESSITIPSSLASESNIFPKIIKGLWGICSLWLVHWGRGFFWVSTLPLFSRFCFFLIWFAYFDIDSDIIRLLNGALCLLANGGEKYCLVKNRCRTHITCYKTQQF